MKIYVSNKTIKKVHEMIKMNKSGNIQIRKYNIQKDPATNVINKIKLSEEHRKKHKTGRYYTYYISKDKLDSIHKQLGSEVDKEGGFLPALIALLPAILGGISAAGAVAGGAAGIAKAVSDVKANNAKIEEDKRYHDELLKQAVGSGLGEDERVYSSFVKSLNLNEDGSEAVKSLLEVLQLVAKLEKHGEALYLFPPS